MTQLDQKLLTLKLYGNQIYYQSFKKSNQIIKALNISPLYYSLPIQKQLIQDLQNLQKLKLLYRQNIINKQCIKFICLHAFTPAYTLLTHSQYFVRYFELCNQKVKQKYSKQIKQFKLIGGILNQTLNTNGQKNDSISIEKRNGKFYIKQNQNNYFYSETTNIFINCAIIISKNQQNKHYLPVFIKLRDQKHNLLQNVQTKYFGQVTSPQYRLIGYNLNNYEIQHYQSQNKLFNNKVEQYKNYCQFQLSLFQLFKAIHITIKYTSMRKQFKTIPNSKQQRKIIQYQAVSSRIIESYSLAILLSSFNVRVLAFPVIISHINDYIQYTHTHILQKILLLRQCCGGFGFLKLSGLPQLIQRVQYRASLNKKSIHFPENDDIYKILMLYSSKSQLKNELFQKGNYDWNSHVTLIKHFHAQMINKKNLVNRRDVDNIKGYGENLIIDMGTGLFFLSQKFNTYRAGAFFMQQILTYTIINNIILNQQYIDEFNIKENKIVYLNKLNEERKFLLIKIQKKLKILGQAFQFDQLNDIIQGREKQDQFYDLIFSTVKQNYRNSKQFLNKVKKPIQQYLVSNNQKL